MTGVKKLPGTQIADNLAEADPEHKDMYSTNYAAFAGMLRREDGDDNLYCRLSDAKIWKENKYKKI